MVPNANRFIEIPVLLVCFTLVAPAAHAGIIDTLPPDSFDPNTYLLIAPDVSGGTFRADGTTLESFTLTVGPGALPSFVGFVPVVLETDASGRPTGTLIWAGGDVTIPVDVTTFTFLPAIPITPGQLYFIGAYNTSFISSFVLGFVAMDLIDGSFWNADDFSTLEFANWVPETGSDIASRIVMTGAPEPSTLTILAFGAVAAGFARHLRSKRLRG